MERCAHDRVSVLMSNGRYRNGHMRCCSPHELFPKFYKRFSVQGIPFVKSHGRSRASELDSTELANLLMSPNEQRSRAKFY